MLISVTDLNKIYNGETVLEHINLNIDEHDRIGLIGVNGCGKSTLIKLIIGEEIPDHFVETDSVISRSSKLTIGYLAQDNGLESNSTVIEAMRSVFDKLLKAKDRMTELEHSGKADSDEYAELLSWFEVNDGYNIDVKIKNILNGMGFGEELFDRTVSGFSGGEKTRLAIAKLLLEEPNLLILDEPTNHLDFNTILWLEDYLASYKGAILVVSHDRYFLDKITTSICEIENKHLVRYKGNYSKYVILKEERMTHLRKEYDAQQKQIDKMQDYVDRNLARASTAKSAKSRIKKLDAMDIIDDPEVSYKKAKLEFTYMIEPPEVILDVKNIDLTVGEGTQRKTLIDDISFTVRRGEKLGIVGDNGIGKSTLLKVLQNKIPHKGIVRWSRNVKYSYFEQESESLDKNLTCFDTIRAKYPSMLDFDIRSLLARVKITGENVFKEVGVISGGERAKLEFALMVLEHGNVLLLDEPTNHLDIYTKEVLEDALKAYTGTIIFVSHDRYLLNKLATSVFELTEGGTELFKGNFDNYMKIKTQRAEAIQRQNDAIKEQKARAEYEQKKENAYKSKKQRAENAKKRQRISELEKNIEAADKRIAELKEEIAKPEVAADFELLNKKCSEIDELQKQEEADFEELADLE